MNDLAYFLLFLGFTIFAAVLHILGAHYYLSRNKNDITEMVISILIMSIMFGTFIYIVKMYSYYFFGSKFDLIDSDIIYIFGILLGSIIYTSLYLKKSIPIYTYIIMLLILLLIILNFNSKKKT